MVTIEWHPKALDDLHLIFTYIARDSRFYANLIIQKIRDQVKNLIDFPRIGRVVPELNNKDIRELIIQEYRVIYQIFKTNLVILAIFHSKQQINS